MRAEIIEGATLPDYELQDHTDTPRKLSLLQGDDPMILTFNRGVYCPKDRQQLLQLAEFSKQCAVGFIGEGEIAPRSRRFQSRSPALSVPEPFILDCSFQNCYAPSH